MLTQREGIEEGIGAIFSHKSLNGVGHGKIRVYRNAVVTPDLRNQRLGFFVQAPGVDHKNTDIETGAVDQVDQDHVFDRKATGQSGGRIILFDAAKQRRCVGNQAGWQCRAATVVC